MPRQEVLDELVVIGFQTQPRDDAEKYIAGIQSHLMPDSEKATLRMAASTTPYLCEIEAVTMHLVSKERGTESVHLQKPDNYKGLLGPRFVKQMLDWFPLLFTDNGGIDYAGGHPVMVGFDIDLFTTLVGFECAEQKDNTCPCALVGGLWNEDVRKLMLPEAYCGKVPVDLAIKRLGITTMDNLGYVPGLDAVEDAMISLQAVVKFNTLPYLNKKIKLLVESIINDEVLPAEVPVVKAQPPAKAPAGKQKRKFSVRA